MGLSGLKHIKAPKLIFKVIKNIKVTVPKKAKDLLDKIKANNGTPPKRYKEGKIYNNKPKNGEAKLPDGVNYKEYDVNPKIEGVPRDDERIVIGDDGSNR